MPLPLSSHAGMRLNEASAHSWDVRVAFDKAAAIDERTASLVIDHFASGLGFLLGFTGKADQVAEPSRVALGDLDRVLAITDSVAVVPAGADSNVTATFVGPADAVARLLSGRLTARHTPRGRPGVGQRHARRAPTGLPGLLKVVGGDHRAELAGTTGRSVRSSRARSAFDANPALSIGPDGETARSLRGADR